jgi:hypothetical protein
MANSFLSYLVNVSPINPMLYRMDSDPQSTWENGERWRIGEWDCDHPWTLFDIDTPKSISKSTSNLESFAKYDIPIRPPITDHKI